ncbi:MAG: Trk system potassium transporter TrkA [Clostridiales bacterium]|nr:Trk system potassium transporter TrkA [Clostridiales bacterium]
MKIIIIGCGRVGASLAEKLNADGNKVTMIDMQASKVEAIANRCDVMGIVGNGATHTVQREAGVASADLLIAVTNSDELNLLCCVIAKKEGKCQTIARVKNPEYSKETAYLKEQMGLAMVINPEYAVAEEIARVLRFPAASKIEPFAKGKVELIKFKLGKSSHLVGISVKEMAMKYRPDILVCTVERGEDAYIAGGDFVFEEKDVVSIIGTPKHANEFFQKIHYAGNTIKNALVVGGGVITHYLCEILENSGISLKVIEKDLKVCEELCTRWQKADVIHGNPSDRELLQEEGIQKAGAFVTLSEVDEENILLSLFAQEFHSGKLITKINRDDYDSVINRLDLETVICPISISADHILRFVRATRNAKGSNVETLYNMIPGAVEAAEFIIKENSSIVGKPLSELKFKKGVLIASISRDGQIIIPRGQDMIMVGDAVVIVSKHLGLEDVTDILR